MLLIALLLLICIHRIKTTVHYMSIIVNFWSANWQLLVKLLLKLCEPLVEAVSR